MMPISDDEFEFRSSSDSNQQVGMSKAELRKTHKPIMEKRRRARINTCLNEIKSLILEAMNKDPARHSKLEKADILEMAVKHLQNVQRQQLAIAIASDPSVIRKFKSGFNECAQEIDRYVGQSETVEPGIKERMRTHLQKCITGIEQVAHFNLPGFPFINPPPTSTVYKPTATSATSDPLGDQNNNGGRLAIPQSIQLIPSRLASGEIALVVPNSTNLAPFLPNLAHIPARTSAFATVVPSSAAQRPPSPSSPKSRGFRPVNPQIVNFEQQEVKTIKFPIHSYAEKSPRKTIEPLCIITNQGERFKQAQVREDGAEFEENRQQGVKRKREEEGLLAVVGERATMAREERPSTSREEENEGNGDMWRPW